MPNAAHLDRLKSLLDSDSGEQDDSELKKKVKKQIKRKPKPSSGVLSDSDAEQSNDEARPAMKEKQKRKRKNDTKTKAESRGEIRTARDILASLNLFFDDDDDDDEHVLPPVRTDSAKLASASSEDESSEGLHRNARSARKMTAQKAMEDRQIIQSESQRMAREKYIDVPYHRTKVFSFEEFRARKTICKPDPLRDCTGSSVSTNQSIRMTAQQLEEFARKLQERELESQQFFKSESETSDPEPENDGTAEEKIDNKQQDCVAPESMPDDARLQEKESEMLEDSYAVDEPSDKQNSSDDITPPSGTDTANTPGVEQIDPIDEIVNRTSDNMEQMMDAFKDAENCPTSAPDPERTEINYDAFSSESRSTTLAAKKAALLADLKLPPCPRLSGSSDMLIDLDSGTVQPKAPSGVDILFERLAKCSGSGQNPTSPANKKTAGILST
uniref:Uncharacterized protein n=1 Tax=Anopheles maculatus TaxID=74869 RepID=A0A182S5V7_9DIPT